MDQDDKDVFELDINLLEPNPLQPRGLITPESLAELAESIRTHGVLEPIVVAKTPAGYQIIAGERRWRASKLAGLNRVPVLIKETSPQGMLEMAIVENVQRQDLNPLERAQAYRRLMDEFNLTNAEIAQRVGKSPAYISNTIRLLTLPDALKDALMLGQTTEGHVRALAALEDPHLIIEAYREVLKKSLSVRATEELVRKMRSHHGVLPRSAPTKMMHIVNEEVDDIQSRLTSTFSTLMSSSTNGDHSRKPAVKYTLSSSQASLQFKLPGDPEKTKEVVSQICEAITTYFTQAPRDN